MNDQDCGAYATSPFNKRERLAEAVTTLAVGLVGGAFVIWGLWSTAASSIGWLKTGVWTHPTLLEVGQRFGYGAPTYDWVIVQRVALWFVGLPSGVVFICLGLCLISAAQKMDDDASDRRLMARDIT
ncbi:hypothetical protein [Brevundimonas sp.]|uniref:hypothetical protein n=1 Tax=Brevundimonas sp. TaxID=1871086 RepID=UPI00289876DA|nr:hypothetical protein [Brevundimonas sp.]